MTDSNIKSTKYALENLVFCSYSDVEVNENNIHLGGYVYVLGNSAMPNVFKVGMTTRTVSERVAELSKSTSIPSPFYTIKAWHSTRAAFLEREIHKLLEPYRLNKGREFFTCPIQMIIDAKEAVDGEGWEVGVAREQILNESRISDSSTKEYLGCEVRISNENFNALTASDLLDVNQVVNSMVNFFINASRESSIHFNDNKAFIFNSKETEVEQEQSVKGGEKTHG